MKIAAFTFSYTWIILMEPETIPIKVKLILNWIMLIQAKIILHLDHSRGTRDYSSVGNRKSLKHFNPSCANLKLFFVIWIVIMLKWIMLIQVQIILYLDRTHRTRDYVLIGNYRSGVGRSNFRRLKCFATLIRIVCTFNLLKFWERWIRINLRIKVVKVSSSEKHNFRQNSILQPFTIENHENI